MLYLLLAARLDEARHEFDRESDAIAKSVEQKLLANEALLDGFAAFLLAVGQGDRAAVSRYASTALANHPHINSLEVAREVHTDELPVFERVMRRSWRADFQLKTFNNGGAALLEAAAATTWPVIFMYPELPEAKDIYGVRVETVGLLRQTMAQADSANGAIASPTFAMIQGEPGYALLRKARRQQAPTTDASPNFFGRSMLALLIVRASALIPEEKPDWMTLTASLQTQAPAARSALFQFAAAPISALSARLLPRLEHQLEIGTPSQSVSLNFSRQLHFAALLTPATLAFMGLGLAIFVLVIDLLRRHDRADQLAGKQLEQLAYAQQTARAGFWDRNFRKGSENWSEGCFRLFGLDPAVDRSGYKIWWNIVHPDDRKRAALTVARCLREGGPLFNQYRIRLKDGSIRWIEAYGQVEHDAAGKPLRFSGICLDVSERRQAELAILSAKEAAEKASRTKSEFLAAVSHDLRHPIAVIHLFADALKQSPLTAEQQRFTANIERSATTLSEMLAHLLDIARLEGGFVEPRLTPLRSDALFTWIDDQFSGLFIARKLRFKLHFPACELDLHTDGVLLKDILRNVIGNALKYTPIGGVLIGLRRRRGQAVIQVFDTGVGIPEAHLPRIFDEYYQIANPERDLRKGIGLGLALVRRKAALIGADIALRSVSGRGSCFEIRLPLAGERIGRA